MDKLKPYTDLLDASIKDSAFIVGAGTSILNLRCHPLRQEMWDHPIACVNSAILVMPWEYGDPSERYWISNDSLCRKWGYWDKVKKSKANKIVRDSWSKYYSEIPDFHYFWKRPTSEGIINAEDQGLAYCSSVPSAIDFFLQIGHKRIFLLGLDHYMVMGKSHFWQFDGEEDRPAGWNFLLSPQSQQENVFFNYNNLAFEALQRFAETKSIEIFNCNPKSKVEAFDKISLDKCLEMLG